MGLARKATTRSGSRIVQDEIYDAEKDLLVKLQGVSVADGLEDVLVECAQGLSSSASQVEQSRLKAAEVGAALCVLGRQSSRMRGVIKQQLSQLQSQERSIAVQQCLERAVKSLDV